jgi:hypothetical protein
MGEEGREGWFRFKRVITSERVGGARLVVGARRPEETTREKSTR